jgi:hypothetical protein
LPHKPIGNGSEEAGAVTATSVGINAAAMREPSQSFESVLDKLVRGGSSQLDQHADATSIAIGRELGARRHYSSSLQANGGLSTIENFDGGYGFFVRGWESFAAASETHC